MIFTTIIIAQLIALALDNYSQLFLIDQAIFKKNKAMAYIRRDQVSLITRVFIFAVPPLLGVLALDQSIEQLILLLIFSSGLSLMVTIGQWVWFVRQKKIKFTYTLQLNFLLKLIGILAFFFHLFVPFFLNLCAAVFPSHGLWIVQLAPILTVVTAFYVTYYLDPKIAKSIDLNHGWEYGIFELILYRILGRLLLVIFSGGLFFYYL
jgi:hypothetical protein